MFRHLSKPKDQKRISTNTNKKKLKATTFVSDCTRTHSCLVFVSNTPVSIPVLRGHTDTHRRREAHDGARPRRRGAHRPLHGPQPGRDHREAV